MMDTWVAEAGQTLWRVYGLWGCLHRIRTLGWGGGFDPLGWGGGLRMQNRAIYSQDFRPPKIINICWKRGLGPRALNLAFPKTPRVLSGAMEDRIEAFFEHFPSGPGQLLAGQSFRKQGGVWALFLLSVV